MLRGSVISIFCNFRTIATILIITGTHGSETGASGLKNQEQLDHFYYVEDCKMVGVKNATDELYALRYKAALLAVDFLQQKQCCFIPLIP